MEQSRSHRPRHNRHGSRGFTIIEVLVASVVLLIGLVSVAGLLSSTLGNTARGGYMNQAATLATEKLEDLSRYPSKDPVVSNGGSLTSDTVANSVPYFDEVYFNPALGGMEETIGEDNNGTTQYFTTSYSPGGQITTTAATSSGPSTSGEIAYKRRWVVEQDAPVNGVKRITVLVSLENTMIQPPVSFQMTTVRP